MSKITIKMPVHTPSFKTYQTTANHLIAQLPQGVTIPFGMLDYNYFYTDLEGWGTILYDLVLKSNLYKPDKFDCEDYALKTMTLCKERYGLNSFGVAIGNTPLGRHGFNIFYYGGGFMLFEPNDSFRFAGEAFEIGGHEYKPQLVLL